MANNKKPGTRTKAARAQRTRPRPAAGQPADVDEKEARLMELDQPLSTKSLDVKWAKGLMRYLPYDLRRQIQRHVNKITDEPVGWMDIFDDYAKERRHAQGLIGLGVEFGFAIALARFREPLTAHAPQARALIQRLEHNRKAGTAATKNKPVKARDTLRQLMADARAAGRDVTISEVMSAPNCSRTTAWRRITELELNAGP